jgi:hypothetical protein
MPVKDAKDDLEGKLMQEHTKLSYVKMRLFSEGDHPRHVLEIAYPFLGIYHRGRWICDIKYTAPHALTNHTRRRLDLMKVLRK